MERRSVTDILVSVTKAFDEFKKEGLTTVSANQLREKTGLPSSNMEKYLQYFEELGKIKVTVKVDERGLNRVIDLTNFDLSFN